MTMMMFKFSSLLLLLALSNIVAIDAIPIPTSRLLSNDDSNNKSCDLECPTNSPCRFGSADFSGHVDALAAGTEIDRNGMHCDCPIGWTGLLCDKKYETCTNQNGHECYNGGECILGLQDQYGNEQLFCDCSNAPGYVGKYCETPFEKNCGRDSDADGDVFCVNGGECNPLFPESSSQPCFCDEGWEGYHCEYKKNEVPDCTLDCQNDGVCFVGAVDKSEQSHPGSRDEDSDEHMFCKCLPGFGGRLCEAPAEQCGNRNGHVCLNGGECVTTTAQLPDGMIRSQHHCDCATATNADNDRFAGKYCEHEATSMCSDSDWNLFCTQGGTCKNNPIEGCSCPDGTAGFKCEFILDSSEQHDTARDDTKSKDSTGNHDHSFQTNQNDHHHKNNKNRTTPCNDGHCLNGGNCVTEQIILQDGSYDLREYCDCSQAFDAISKYAGRYCQYQSTDVCLKENSHHDVEPTFCVHFGRCNEDGSCGCLSGWAGRHCEMKILDLEPNSAGVEDADDFDECGDTVCYNGGTCTQTERLHHNGNSVVDTHCDCSTAFDGKYFYAGLSCEFPSTEICMIPEAHHDSQGRQELAFCTNHGTCSDDIQFGCDCPPGFYGPACEFESHEIDNNVNNNEAEEEGGVVWEVCGQGVCHHGGKCMATTMYIEEAGTTMTFYSCDCSTAYDDDTAYLGLSCEYPSTSICVPPESGHPLSSARFCVNEGACGQDPSEDCDCTDAFSGKHCEFKADLMNQMNSKNVDGDGDSKDDEVCGDDLVCLNGGKCVTAIATDKNGDSVEVQKCDCESTWNGIDIFAGHSCEYKATSFCASPTLASFCVNGGICQENDTCDCKLPWKGTHCEFPVQPKDFPDYYDDGVGDVAYDTDICTVGDEYPGQPLYFCVNGGLCNNWVSGNDPDPGCTCPDGFTGPHCEVTIAIAEKRASAPNIRKTVLIAGILLALLCIIALFVRYARSKLTGKTRGLPPSIAESNPVPGGPFSPRRRRKAGFGTSCRSSKRKSSVSATVAPSSSSADRMNTDTSLDDENDGVMNDDHRLQDEVPPDDSFVENIPLDDGSTLQGAQFV